MRIADEMRLRQAGNACTVSKSAALHRVVSRYKAANEDDRIQFYFERKHGFKHISDDAEENILVEYLVLKPVRSANG